MSLTSDSMFLSLRAGTATNNLERRCRQALGAKAWFVHFATGHPPESMLRAVVYAWALQFRAPARGVVATSPQLNRFHRHWIAPGISSQLSHILLIVIIVWLFYLVAR
jgi:hypothetical protein